MSKMFPSKWLASADLEGRTPTVTIRAITVERVGAPPQDENKYVMWFEGKDKGLILNKTNGVATGQLYGDETDLWVGNPIQLYTTKVKAFGAVHDAIRIRSAGTVSAAAMEPVEAEPEDVAEYDEPIQVDGPSYIDSLDDAPEDTAASVATPPAKASKPPTFKSAKAAKDWGIEQGAYDAETVDTAWDIIKDEGKPANFGAMCALWIERVTMITAPVAE